MILYELQAGLLAVLFYYSRVYRVVSNSVRSHPSQETDHRDYKFLYDTAHHSSINFLANM